MKHNHYKILTAMVKEETRNERIEDNGLQTTDNGGVWTEL